MKLLARVGCIALISALATPALADDYLSVAKTPAPPEVQAVALPAGTKGRSIGLVKVVEDIPVGTYFAAVGTGRKCEGAVASYWTPSDDRMNEGGRMERIFLEEMTANGFPTRPDRATLFKADNEAAAELEIGARVTDFSAYLCLSSGEPTTPADPHNIGTGGAQMSVEWQVWSPSRKQMLGRYTTTARWETDDALARPLMELLEIVIRDNVRALTARDGFRDLVVNKPTGG